MLDTDIADTVSSARLYEHLRHWEGVGCRVPGSEAERRARDYVADGLERSGIETRIEEFEYCRWSPVSTEVTVQEPIRVELDCAPISHVASTEVEGELVFVGEGRRADFEAVAVAGVNLEDAIVLASTGIPFVVTPLVEEFGASGLLVISNAPSGLVRRLTGSFYRSTVDPVEMRDNPAAFPADVPAAVIPEAEGWRLLQLSNAGSVRVRLRNEADYAVDRSWNVVGEIPGHDLADETVVIGAHYDTQFGVPGVLDNGTGLAGLLEIANCFVAADVRPERTVEFVAFGCEESGGWGSVEYTQRHVVDSDREYVAMFNLDSFGSTLVPNHDLWGSGPVRDLVVGVADEIGFEIDAIKGFEAPIGDGAPFVDQDVPTAWIVSNRPPSPYYHTEQDDSLEHVDLRNVRNVVELFALCCAAACSKDRYP